MEVLKNAQAESENGLKSLSTPQENLTTCEPTGSKQLYVVSSWTCKFSKPHPFIKASDY